jgi:hypothetical protein
MGCSHDGFHAIRVAYDRKRGMLLYFWTCERCGARLREAGHQDYRPSFDPHGNDPCSALRRGETGWARP